VHAASLITNLRADNARYCISDRSALALASFSIHAAVMLMQPTGRRVCFDADGISTDQRTHHTDTQYTQMMKIKPT